VQSGQWMIWGSPGAGRQDHGVCAGAAIPQRAAGGQAFQQTPRPQPMTGTAVVEPYAIRHPEGRELALNDFHIGPAASGREWTARDERWSVPDIGASTHHIRSLARHISSSTRGIRSSAADIRWSARHIISSAAHISAMARRINRWARDMNLQTRLKISLARHMRGYDAPTHFMERGRICKVFRPPDIARRQIRMTRRQIYVIRRRIYMIRQ
jgi:hypothetical protein